MAHPRCIPEQLLVTATSRVRRTLGASAVVMLLGANSLHCSAVSDDDDDHPPPFPGGGQVNTPVPERPVTQPDPNPDSGRDGTGGTRSNPVGSGDTGGTSAGGTNSGVGAGGTNSGVGGGPNAFAGNPSFSAGGRTPFPNAGGSF